ncbi:reverse transcriptase-7, partial [Lasius niger]
FLLSFKSVVETEEQETVAADQEMSWSQVAIQSPEQVADGSQQQNQVTTTTTTTSSQSSQPSTDDSSFILDLESSNVECVEMPFNRVFISHAYCFICKSKTDLHDVPYAAQMQVFVKRRIFIPKRNRCCSKHLIKNRFYEDEVDQIQIFSNESSIEITELAAFMEKLSDEVDFQFHDHIGKYAISEERVKALTGYSWNDITIIKNMLVRQKKTALCKPFTICTTNGFVVDVCGPFNATKNDAQILEHLLQLPDGLNNILKKGDIIILDRGFRDVKPLLEQKGFEVLMPALKGHRNQLTTEESNQSRLVTKLRWVVEAIHGIIGQKTLLASV